jgi:branched-chain amino acid transport system substrate-binding protein
MSQKNETPALLLALLLTIGLIGTAVWWFTRGMTSQLLPGQNAPNAVETAPTAKRTPFSERWSVGARSLTQNPSTTKLLGITAIADQEYAGAAVALENALQANRNDPEALIYLNNARIGEQEAYTIAVSVPVATSPDPALEILRGVAQAQDEVNRRGGIAGVPLKVMIVSDDNDPTVAQDVANGLVEDESVLGVIGHFGSDATLAAGQIYEQGRLPMISPTSTSVQIANLGDYIFRTVPSDRFTATSLSRYLLSGLEQQNAAIYYNSTSSYSQSLKNEFVTALTSDGGQVVAEFDLSDSGFNALDTLRQAKAQGAEAIVLAANTDTLDAALLVVAVNRQELPILGGDSIYNPKTLQAVGDSAANLVVAVPWILLSDPQSAFVKTAASLWGGDVNWRTAMAYDAAQVLITAMQQEATRDGIQRAIDNPNFSATGATGTIRFLPSGDRNQPMQLVTVEAGTRSGYGYDFVPLPVP